MEVWKLKQMIKLVLFGALFVAGVASLFTVSYAGVVPQAAQAKAVVAGTYAGNVAISEPAPLGALTLVIGLTSNGGALSGEVDPTQTMVFLGGPSVTGQVSQGAKPTIQLESETFTSVVSKRTIQRRFTLVGEVLDNGNSIKGDYVETITGFTPAPMVVKGKFLLTRPGDSQIVLPPRVGGTPTVPPISPKPDITPNTPNTPKPGSTPTSEGESSLLLPYILSAAPAAAAQATPIPEQSIDLPAMKGE
jgi:hypothetical protein